MYLIVGLGNPGTEHEHSRHNAGWIVLEYIMRQNTVPDAVPSAKFSGKIAEGMLEGREATFLFPTTYMNNSGTAVKKLMAGKGKEDCLIVIYDDVDLPLGEIKVSFGRGSGGHNGLQSIIEALGTKDFVRIRIGIAHKTFFGHTKRPKGEDLSRHVLGTMRRGELRKLEDAAARAERAVKLILAEGIEKAMQECN